jgi:adenosylcobinamide-GDP ribazoletransferase
MDGGGQSEADALKRLTAATAFLTRLPVPATPLGLGHALDMFPLVGALIGLFCALIYWGLSALGSGALLAAVIAVTAGLFLTGALHEDGLADTMDSLGGRDRAERLAIMRDSRIGTYGVLALVAAFLIKVLALAGLPGLMALPLLAGAGAFSRAALVWLLWKTPAARAEGLSASVGRPSWPITMRAIATGLVGSALLVGIFAGIAPTIAALLAGAAMTAFVSYRAINRFGGHTGDVCGALQVLSELAILSVFALTVR